MVMMHMNIMQELTFIFTTLIVFVNSRTICDSSSAWANYVNAFITDDVLQFQTVVEPFITATTISYTGNVSTYFPGYSMVLSDTSSGGLHSYAFLSEDSRRMIVAFRGTSSWSDVCADIVLEDRVPPAFCNLYESDYMIQAYGFVDNVKRAFADADIIFTGHSLGCSLSMLMSAVWTNITGVTTPSVCFAPGGGDSLLLRMKLEEKKSCRLALNIPGDPIVGHAINDQVASYRCSILGTQTYRACSICSKLNSLVDPACWSCFRRVHEFKNYINALNQVALSPCGQDFFFDSEEDEVDIDRETEMFDDLLSYD